MEKQTITRRQVQDIYGILIRFEKSKVEEIGRRFAYASTINTENLSVEMKGIAEIVKPIGEYDEKRIKLCEEYATKNEEGNPVLVEDKYQGLDGNEKFHASLKALQKEYQPSLDEINEMMKEEVEVELYQISPDDIPESLLVGEVRTLAPMITG